MRIAIIGAGAAGLAALRHSLDQGHEGVVFEQTGTIGGTWYYTNLTDVDANGLPIHSSMYQGLMTNLPKELMEYEDFAYRGVDRSYVEQNVVLSYMERFADHYQLRPHIKCCHHVLQIDPLPNEKWRVTVRDLTTKRSRNEEFDAVMVCTGNYSTPKLPDIRGMVQLENRAIHSHYYRTSEPYKGKRVLVIGAGPSGTDIARLVGQVADKVFLSHDGNMFGAVQKYVIEKPLVEFFERNVATFADGSEEEVDNVIYCTGYRYNYPFLTPDCDIRVEGNWVKYLFKHVINVEHPTMGFIGITFKVCPFPLFDMQVRFFLEFLKNPRKISREEMMADVLKDVHGKGAPANLVHKIGMPFHQSYFDDLADTVKIKKSKPVLHKLFRHLFGVRDPNKRYRIVNDNEFVELN